MSPYVPDFILQQEQQGRNAGAFEGASLFVDISGFTALTEIAVPYGREGAEAFAKALSFYFDPLVSAVHEAHGFITAFAGDAFTALFPHSPQRSAAAHALDAAHAMQRFLAENPVYVTPYGQFPFMIRIGLSWGKVSWGIVRIESAPVSEPASALMGPSSHRPLPVRSFFYFQGAPIDAAAALEHRAGSGEVLFDGGFRRHVPSADASPLEGEIFRASARGGDTAPAAPVRTRSVPRPATGPGSIPPPPRRSSVPGMIGPTSFAAPWSPSMNDGATYLAPGVYDFYAQGEAGEFRDVVSCFIAFSEVGDVPGLIRLLNELAGGYGGTFTGLDFGDKGINTLIHFGAPISHENDTERALDFALELKRMASRMTRMRAGVTRDVRYVGWNGGTRRKEFACLGRATNLAARLMMKAPWGDLYCDPKVFADGAAAYEFEPRGDFVFKGFELAIEVHALQTKRPIFEQPREFSAKELVGRAAELQRLLASLEPVFQGRFAGLIYIDGDAGLGKSYLVETGRRKLEARGAPFLWLEAPCDQTLQRSLNAFEVALKEYFQQLPASSREENLARFHETHDRLVARIPAEDLALRKEIVEARSIYAAILGHRSAGSLYERLSPKDRFDRTMAAIASWVRAESTMQPVIVHLEDAHWADADTLRAVQTIARMGRTEPGKGPRLAEGLPIVVLATARYRDDGGPFRIELEAGIPMRNIALGPLTAEEIGIIAENVSGRPVPDIFRAMLIDGAGGNPFFAEEIFAYWRDADSMVAEPSISSPSVALLPSDVNSLLIARLDRLPGKVKLTVLAAAVLGKEFDLRVLTAMAAGDPEVVEHVKVAESQRIFAGAGKAGDSVRYRFRNVLLRNAAYEIQARARLQRLHLLAAEAIEQVFEGDLERQYPALARHYRRAAMPERARPWFLAAAREAAARYAHDEAKRHYKSYFKLVDHVTPESVIARYELSRDVYEPRGDLGRAHEEHMRVVDEAQQISDHAAEALGRLGLGRVSWATRRYDEARTYLQQALALSRRAQNHWAEALILAHLALVEKATGLKNESVQTFSHALHIGRELRMHEGASVFGDMVRHVDAQRAPQETLALYERAMSIPSGGGRG